MSDTNMWRTLWLCSFRTSVGQMRPRDAPPKAKKKPPGPAGDHVSGTARPAGRRAHRCRCCGPSPTCGWCGRGSSSAGGPPPPAGPTPCPCGLGRVGGCAAPGVRGRGGVKRSWGAVGWWGVVYGGQVQDITQHGIVHTAHCTTRSHAHSCSCMRACTHENTHAHTHESTQARVHVNTPARTYKNTHACTYKNRQAHTTRLVRGGKGKGTHTGTPGKMRRHCWVSRAHSRRVMSYEPLNNRPFRPQMTAWLGLWGDCELGGGGCVGSCATPNNVTHQLQPFQGRSTHHIGMTHPCPETLRRPPGHSTEHVTPSSWPQKLVRALVSVLSMRPTGWHWRRTGGVHTCRRVETPDGKAAAPGKP